MAHVWKTRSGSSDWVATPADAAEAAAEMACLITRLARPPETWAVVCAPQSDVRVNGEALPLGLAILSDQDEIGRAGHPRQFFSMETLPRVEPFPGSNGRTLCPRCKQALEAGTPAVRCPGCALWYHESTNLPCWTYAPTCAACPYDTDLEAGFRWTPEEL